MIRTWVGISLGLTWALVGPRSGVVRADDPAATEREQARACVAARDWAKAIGHLDRVIAARPGDAWAFLDRGRCHERLHDKARARADWDQAIALRPTLAEAWTERGQLRAEDADPAPALADLSEALRLDPTQDDARLARVGLAVLRDDFDSALADCDALVGRQVAGPEAYEIRGLIRLTRRDGLGAAADFDEAIRRETLLDTTGMVAFRAVAHLLAGRVDLAEADLDQLLDSKPDDSMGRLLRGFLHLNQGRLAQARADVEMIRAVTPDDPNALNLLVGIALKERRFADALAAIDRLIALQPDRARHLVTRAATREEQGDPAGALADFGLVLSRKPDEVTVADLASALAGQAWIWATAPDDRLRDGARALRTAERACALTEHPQGVALQARAAALAEVGRFDEAVRTAEQARAAQQTPPAAPDTTLHAGKFTISFEGDLIRIGGSTPRDSNDRPLDAYRQHQPYRDRR